MKYWFSEKLDKISKVDSYIRPERIKDSKICGSKRISTRTI